MGLGKQAAKTAKRPAFRRATSKKPVAEAPPPTSPGSVDSWRHDNIGRLMNSAIRRFEARVLDLMKDAGYIETRISHVNLTRNLDRSGTRVTELAKRAAMTKQAMGELVDQCVRMGLVERVPDPADGRARTVRFTRAGLAWLDQFRKAVDRAEREMTEEVGLTKLAVTKAALARYGAPHNVMQPVD